MSKTTYYSHTTLVTDLTTGEVGRVETVKRQKIQIETDNFYMVFIDYVAPLFKLTNGTAKSVLTYLCNIAEFNTGAVSLSIIDRQKIVSELNISKTTLSRSLSELVEKRLLKGEKGSYIINPQIFWKGDLKTRKALLDTKEIQVWFAINPESAQLQTDNKPDEITEITE